MRLNSMIGGVAAALTLSLILPTSASAGWERYDRNSAYDPYAYRYEHRGYYPYYGSDYWRPAHKVKDRRFRFVQPKYYWAWGYYKEHRHKYHHSHEHGTPAHSHRKHHW
jgi:hypothetical protein